MHGWRDNDLLTEPQRVQIATTELLPLVWDYTALLDVGESLTNPLVRVSRVRPTPIVALTSAVSGSPAIQGNYVGATINGEPLVRDGLYEIIVTATTAIGKELSVMTMLECIA